MCICQKFLTDRRQRVVVAGAASEWIPVVFVVPRGSVLCPLSLILYASEIFDLLKTIMFAYNGW